jgi:D-alanyl-D-alanine carboxypeptidase
LRPRFPLALLATASLVVTLAGCTSAATIAAQPDSSAALGAPVSAAGLGVEDGYIPDGQTVSLTDDVPAVTKLDAHLRDALVRASEKAADRGVTFTLTDGWRSERYQEYLFARAVTEYGSAEEASKWVKHGDQSKHVRGEAVDISTADAMDWLVRFGGEFGLCQIYANESWHFELAADESGTCPALLVDGTAG